jgi:hypothetical protein
MKDIRISQGNSDQLLYVKVILAEAAWSDFLCRLQLAELSPTIVYVRALPGDELEAGICFSGVSDNLVRVMVAWLRRSAGVKTIFPELRSKTIRYSETRGPVPKAGDAYVKGVACPKCPIGDQKGLAFLDMPTEAPQ